MMICLSLATSKFVLQICYDKKDYDEIEVNEVLTHNLIPVQSYYVSKIRSTCNNFRKTVQKIINAHKFEVTRIEKILKNLWNNKSVRILRHGKGKGTVIRDKDDNNNKMSKIQNDTTHSKLLKQIL